MSFSEAPTTAIKGQRELLEWYSLPKEANGCEVWVPIPKRFSPLLGDTTILSTLGANLPQALLVCVRVFWLTNLSYPTGNSPFFISSHSYHFPSHGLSWHLFWRSVVSRNHLISNILFIYHVMENTMYPAFWFRKCAYSIYDIHSIWMKGKVCSCCDVLVLFC